MGFTHLPNAKKKSPKGEIFAMKDPKYEPMAMEMNRMAHGIQGIISALLQ
jgi:hypothetical protein